MPYTDNFTTLLNGLDNECLLVALGEIIISKMKVTKGNKRFNVNNVTIKRVNNRYYYYHNIKKKKVIYFIKKVFSLSFPLKGPNGPSPLSHSFSKKVKVYLFVSR